MLALEDRQHEHLDVEPWMLKASPRPWRRVRMSDVVTRAVRVPKSLEDRAELVGIEDSRHDKDG